MLNPQSPLPLYRQLADLLAARIRSGELAPGSRIPSEHQLAAAYNIGRPTARQAIDTLVRKGLLRRRRGSGTYVCEPQQEIDLFSLEGTSASFVKKGVATETKILAPISGRHVNGQTDNPFNERQAFFFSRLTMVQNVPVVVEDLYLSTDLFAGIDAVDLEGRSLSAIAYEYYHLQPTGGKQRFQIGYAAGRRASQLQVCADVPVLVVHRYLHFPHQPNGVYSQLWCRSDQFAFTQTIGGAVHA